MNRSKSRIGTVQSIEARNQLLNEFIKEEGKKNGGGEGSSNELSR